MNINTLSLISGRHQGWLKGGVFLKPPLELKILENPYS